MALTHNKRASLWTHAWHARACSGAHAAAYVRVCVCGARSLGSSDPTTKTAALPRLTALKSVTIDSGISHIGASIADEVRLELYSALQPRGGTVEFRQLAWRDYRI